MSQGPYNPQEVLAPLMQRFGRHLTAPRDVGFEQMIAVACERLNIHSDCARQLLRQLECAGLIEYELPIHSRQGTVTWEGTPVTGAPSDKKPTESEPDGRWRIGPQA